MYGRCRIFQVSQGPPVLTDVGPSVTLQEVRARLESCPPSRVGPGAPQPRLRAASQLSMSSELVAVTFFPGCLSVSSERPVVRQGLGYFCVSFARWHPGQSSRQFQFSSEN